MQEVLISPFEGCSLIIRGDYLVAEPEIGYPAQFIIDSIESIEKDLLELLEWATGTNVDYLRYIEELVIQKLEEE